MKLRWYSWVGIALLAFVLVAGAAVAWIVSTNAGARWAVARAQGFLGEKLRVERVEGALAGPLTLTNFVYRDPAAGIEAAAEYVSVDLAFLRLFGMTVHVVTAELRGVDVRLTEPSEPQPEPPNENQPFTLEAPIDIVVERFVLNDLAVTNRGQPVVTIDSATFVGQWIGSAIAIRQLDVQSPDGEAHFVAAVRQSRYYEGEGNGRFRWKAGERTFAGALEANGRDGATNLRVDLTAPLTATLAVEFQQTEELPWKLGLDVPTFDPRESLLPDSSLQKLAARLHGAGTRDEGSIAGVIEVNGEPIRFERLRLAQREGALDLDALARLGGGSIAATGIVHTAQEPLAATLHLDWSDVVVPESLAGQAIFTRGRIDFEGSADAYRAAGTLSAGPEGRIADLELQVQGTAERVAIERLDIVQRPGRFAMHGTVDLQPQIGWSLRAQARRFDPGAFAVEWPGSLNFDLQTQGVLLDAGPQATVVVENLRGTLRNRELGGGIDLTLLPGMAIAGDLDLRSGQSRIRLVGRSREAMDAVATVSVPSLNDWLPDASGELRGRVTARGKWPDLDVAGELNGRRLKVGTTVQADRLRLVWNIARPTDPSGRATLSASKLAAGGFEFDTLRVQAEGDKSRHSVDFESAGAPLGAALLVEGSLDGSVWDGTIQRLLLDIRDAARLTLQAPVRVRYSPELVEMSQACFADGDIRVCAQGDRAANGVMHASYSLQNVPLALVNAFVPMPLRFAGTLEGNGDIASTEEGALKGRADIRSASGRISREAEDEDAPPEVLLSYADLNVSAELDGSDARMRLSARLDDGGALNGRVALNGLTESATNLEGEFAASLPSLRAIELFAPQLANVQGRADLRADVRGTLDDPQVTGELRISELGMDVPAAGLELRQGSVTVSALDAKRFKIAGGIASGPGRIDFDGAAATDGSVGIKLAGKQFQAANIPSAAVIVEPDLSFERGAERMTLTGSLHIPAATIDLSKLPQSEGTRGVSQDVIIVDAETQEAAEQAAQLPLHAQIKVTLGEKVMLLGYGLNARVLGQLTVNEKPGAPTTGSGEVRVEGTYKAYGQDLTIQKGQLVYAGTPLDNPRLDLVAVRKIEAVTAGLRVTGSAQSPQLTVFSDPVMGQSDALAYLVTGKPLSEVGQGDADEGDMLQTAARSLGTAAGSLIAKNIGQRLGIDEFGVTDNEAIGGAALTIGQYLSPRLYLGYGVGLFEPGQVITLRYKLSRSLSLEVLNATQDQRAGLEYRKER
jgi:translocation and assembly module TamB